MKIVHKPEDLEAHRQEIIRQMAALGIATNALRRIACSPQEQKGYMQTVARRALEIIENEHAQYKATEEAKDKRLTS